MRERLSFPKDIQSQTGQQSCGHHENNPLKPIHVAALLQSAAIETCTALRGETTGGTPNIVTNADFVACVMRRMTPVSEQVVTASPQVPGKLLELGVASAINERST
jgi:hypothetical protein